MFKKKLAIALGMVAVLSLTACSKGTVAKVNDTEITADDLKVAKAIITSVNEYKTGKGAEDMSKEEEEELEKNAATFLVDSEVVYQQAIADGITVKSEDNDSRTSELKEALKENPKFKKDLEDNGVTEESLENFIAKDNVINAYRDAFNEKQTVSDAEISAYYAKHREEFKKDMVDASHILFATVDRNQNAVSDEKKEEIKKTAEEVQKRAASGEDFAALAKKYSDDKKTGEKGGDLGYFTKDAKDALFTREVFKLKKGDVSKLIATNNGYEIVKINDIKSEIVINAYRDAFNEKQTVSDAEISAYYAKHREEFKKDMVDASHILFATVDRNQNAVSDEKKEEIKKTAEEVQKRAASGEDFAALAKKYSDDKKTGEKGGDLGYFTKDAKDALFTREVFKLKKGDVSKLIATNNGYEIVKINDIKSEIKELDKCKEEIKKKILDEKYIKHVEQLVEKAEVK